MGQKNIYEVLGGGRLFFISSLLMGFMMVSCSHAAVSERDTLEKKTQKSQDKITIQSKKLPQKKLVIAKETVIKIDEVKEEYYIHRGHSDRNTTLKLCRDYLDILNAHTPFPKNNADTVNRKYVTALPVSKKYGPFKNIKWQAVDPESKEGLEALRRFATEQNHRFFLYETVTTAERRRLRSDWIHGERSELLEAFRPTWESKYKAKHIKEVKEGTRSLGRARLDLNSDGKGEWVYRSGTMQAGSINLDIQDPQAGYLASYLVLPQDDESMAKSTPEQGSIGQAFLYNDRFYMAFLISSGKSLYQSRQSKLGRRLVTMSPVCEFHIKNRK